MKHIIAHIRLLRPLNLFTGAFAVWVSGAILGELDQTSILILAIMTVVFYNAGANALNDYIDLKTDQVNRPNRPLVTGDVNPKTALTLFILFAATGSVTALWLPTLAAIIAIIITLPLMIYYNTTLKSLPLVGNAVIALILGLVFLFSGAALGNITPMIIPACLAFGLTFLRELIKDIEDIEGDTKANLNTFPTRYGVKKAKHLALLLLLIVAVSVLIPWWVGLYNVEYLFIILAGIEIPLLIIGWLFYQNFETERYAGLAAKLLKFSTIAGVVAIYLG